MRRPRIFPSAGAALALLAITSLLACSGKLAQQAGLKDSDLFARGQQKATAKKYADAVEAYQLLLERFPNSPLAPRAQLGLAEARMADKENIEAEVAFDDFLRLYPADEKAGYALFRKGELLARQAGDPGRDQGKTQEAIRAFTLAREKNPSGPDADRAGTKIRELRNRLARNEAYVITHYMNRKMYDSAEDRARRAIRDYPDVEATPALFSLLADSLERGKKTAEAAEVRKQLAEKFPSFGAKKR